MILHKKNSNCVQFLAQSLPILSSLATLTHQSIETLYSEEMELHDDDKPTSLYTDRADKRRILPCVECGETVNGVRQCTKCFGHLHRTCGTSQQPGFRSAGAVCAYCSGGDMSPNQSQILTQAMFVESPPPACTSGHTINLAEAPPTQVYTRSDKSLHQRIFPCPVCGDHADGSHQCGICFRHVHVFCAAAFPGSAEGYGQLLVCPGACNNQLPESTQTSARQGEASSSSAVLHMEIPPPPTTIPSPTGVVGKRKVVRTKLPHSKGVGGWSINQTHDLYIGLDVTDRSMHYHYIRRLRYTTHKVYTLHFTYVFAFKYISAHFPSVIILLGHDLPLP